MGREVTFKRLSIAFSVLIFLLYAGLILCLFYFYDGSLFLGALRSARTLFSLKLSLVTATAATAISVFFAVPAAYALSRYRFPGRQIIDTILELPLIVSPIALGALVLIFFNTPAGRFIQENGIQVVFTVYGILLAQFITTVESPRASSRRPWTRYRPDTRTPQRPWAHLPQGPFLPSRFRWQDEASSLPAFLRGRRPLESSARPSRSPDRWR